MITSVNNGKTLLDPQTYDMLLGLKQDIFRSMNCVKIGQIQSFDPAKKTAIVQILFKRVVPSPNGNEGQMISDYPVLLDVPVMTVQGGGGALQMPIAAGDQCILLFSDRNMDAWFKTGGAAAPFNARCHDLSDGLAIVGVNAAISSLPNPPTDRVRLLYKDTSIDLLESGIAFLGTGGAEVDLASGIVTIKNGTTTLLALMNGMLDVLKALTVQDGSATLPLTTAAIASLEAYKLLFEELIG